MYALGDSNRIPPYRLAPYEDRCHKMGLETLANRRKEANVLLAYDLYNGRINDSNIDNKLIKVQSKYNLRDERLLMERVYKTDYEFNQPIAKVTRFVNEFSDIMTLSRNKFRTEVRKRILDQNNRVTD